MNLPRLWRIDDPGEAGGLQDLSWGPQDCYRGLEYSRDGRREHEGTVVVLGAVRDTAVNRENNNNILM